MHTHHTTDLPRPELARKMRLVGKLLRTEMHKTLQGDPTRGEVEAAARAIDDRIAEAVTPAELETTLTALDKIAEAFGGEDALPFRPHLRRGRGFGPSFGHGRRGHGHQRFAA